MTVCLQIMQALKMHKGVNELRLLSNTLMFVKLRQAVMAHTLLFFHG